PWETTAASRRYGRLRLPSRRSEGARRVRGGLRSRAGSARRGTRRLARLWQHVGGKRALRARTHADAQSRRWRAVGPSADDRARARFYGGVFAARRGLGLFFIVVWFFVLAGLGGRVRGGRDNLAFWAAGAV